MSEQDLTKSPKKVYISFFLLIFVAGLVVVFSRQTQKPAVVAMPKVNSFEECAKLGYPIMESYPRQCSSPDGKFFVETMAARQCQVNTDCPSGLACLDGECKKLKTNQPKK